MATAESSSLFARYVAQCHADAIDVLTRLCRDVGAGPADRSPWASPAQRQAREALARLAPAWVGHLARPTSPKSAAIGLGSTTTSATTAFGAPSGLALMSDDDVDEDIASTRVVQSVESAAEWSLRDLRSRLASANSPAGTAGDDPLPLAPARVVGALCAALHDEPLATAERLAALRTMTEPLAQAMADLYQRHAEMLADWGLQPARYTIRQETSFRPGAKGTTPAEQAAATNDKLDVPSAQIPALLAHVAAEAGLSRGMQGLMGRLAAPVAHSVAADPALLESMSNPLWRLIDRLAALGQLDAEPSPGTFHLPLHLRLEPIIARLEQAAQPMPIERYAQALVEAEAEAGHAVEASMSGPGFDPTAPMALVAAQNHVLGAAGPAPAIDRADAHVASERAQQLESVVRQQMVARLRDSQVIPEVKQFLLGPWLGTIVHAVDRQGEESAEAQRVLRAVESLIDAGTYDRRAPLTPAEVHCLRMEAEDGLAAAGVAKPRIQQHVQDLAAALSAWPRSVPPDTGLSADDLVAEEELAPPLEDEPANWPRHEDLATVPIALDSQNPDERALRDCEAWLDGLAVGDICRVQRQGQWATLRLNWRSDNGAFFAFGNSSGLAFCASRRVLSRMRLEGLATTMSRGQWLRRAVDTLPMPLE